MKERFTIKGFYSISTLAGVLMVILFSGNVFSATYYTRANGNWSDVNSWSTASCGGVAAASVPGAGDDVIITCSGTGRTITVDGNFSCNNLTVGDFAQNATVQITNAANSLTINGILVLNTTNANRTYRLDAGDGTININGTFGGWGTTGTNEIRVNAGTVNITPSITISNNFQMIRITGGGIVNFNGDFTDQQNNLITAPNCLVNFAQNYTVNTTAAAWSPSSVANFTGVGYSITATSQITFGNVQIGGGASVSLVGGNINVAGNWTNQGGTFNPNTNTVTFSGAGVIQSVSKSGGPESFYVLTANQGTSTILLGSDIIISNTLNMSGHGFNLNNNTLQLGNGAGATLTRTGGIIYGGIFKRWFPLGAISSTVAPRYGLFPVGTSTDYRPVEINSPAGPGTSGYVLVNHTASGNITDVAYADNKGDAIQRISDAKHTIATLGLAGGSYDINVTMTGFATVGSTLDLKLETFAGSPPGVGNNVVTAGTVSAPVVKRSSLTVTDLNNDFVVGTKNKTNTPLRQPFYSLGGNWNNAASWSTIGCGGAAASTYPGPDDIVIICAGVTITTANSTHACNTLTVYGTIDFVSNNHTVTVGGNLVMDGAGFIDYSGGIGGGAKGIMNVSGTFTVAATATNARIGGVQFTVNSTTAIDGYFGFSAAPNGAKIFYGNITVSSGVPGTWNNTVGEDPVIYGNIQNNGVWLETIGGTSTYSFKKSGTQYIDGNPINMNFIRIDDVSTVVNRATITVFGNQGIARGNASGGNFINGDGSTAAKLYLAGLPPFDAVGRVTFTADALNNTVYYNDATLGNQFVRIPTGGGGGYYNLVLMNGGTKSFESVGTMAVSNNLTIAQSTIFDVGANTLNGTGGLTMTETSDIQLAKTGVTLPELSGTYALGLGTTVTFNGTTAATQTARAITYANLSLLGTNAASLMDLSGVTSVLGNLTIGSSCRMISNGIMTVGGQLLYSSNNVTGTTLTNNIIVGSFSFSNTGLFNDNAKTITITGASGWSKTGTGTFTTTGEVIFTGGAAQVITGTQTTTFNKLTVNKTAGTILTITTTTNAVIVNNSNAGKLTITEGIFDTQTNTVNGTGIFDATGGEFRTAKLTITQPELGTGTITGGLVLFYGAGTQSIKGITYYNLEVATTPGASTATFAGDAIVSNDFTVTSGTAAIGANSLTVSGTSSITGTFNITSTTGTKNFNNILVNNGGIWNCSVAEDVAVNGNIQNDGTLTSGSGIYSLQGNPKTISGTSGVTISNATVTAAGDYTNNTIFTIPAALIINNPGQLTNNSTVTTSINTSSINGTAGGKILQGPGSTLNIGGTIATITLDASSNANTVKYTNNLANQTIYSPSVSTYHHLTIDKSGFTGILGSNITCNGNFTITLGAFSHSATPYNLTLKGGFVNNGTAAIAGTGKVIFNGGAAQTMAGSTNTVFYGLEISNASGVTLSSVNESVSDVLTLTSGNVNTGNYYLIITSTGTVSRTSGHIDGYLQKNISNTSPYTFEIGSGALYAPINISFASVGVAGNLICKSSSGNNSNISSSDIDPNKTVQHYWEMINSVGSPISFSTYTATFNYAGENQAGVTDDYFVQRYNSGVWTDVVSVVPTPTTTSTTITTETILDRAFQIGVKYDPSVTYTAFTGTASWNVSSTWAQNRTGTISTSSLSNIVTGTASIFWGVDGIQGNADDEIVDGDLIVDQLFPGTVIGTVAAGGVTSPTSLTLVANAASNNAGISFGRKKIPTSLDIAIIGNPNLAGDVTVQVDATPASPVFRMKFFPSGYNNTVDHTVASDLQILNNVVIDQPSAAAKTNTWKINSGTSTVGGNVNIGNNDGSDANTRVSKILITTGQLNISTNLVFKSPAGSSLPAWLDISGSGTVNLAGSINLQNGTGRFTPSATSWFNYNRTAGGGGQTIFLTSPIAYSNLRISTTDGTGAILGAAVTPTNVTEKLWVLTGATLHNGGFAMAGVAGKEFKVDGTFEMTGASDFPSGFTVFTMDPASVVQYHQSDARTIKQINYGHLLIQPVNNNITHTFAAGTTIVFGNLTLGDGVKTGIVVTALTNASNVDIRGTNTIYANTTFIASNSATAVSITGDWINNGTYTAGTGTLIFNNTTATQTIGGTAATHTFYNVIVNKTGSVLLSFSATPTTFTVNNFTLTSGAFTLPVNLATMNLNGNLTLTAGTFTAADGGIINSKGDWTNDGGTFIPGTGTVIFNNTTTQQNINGSNATQSFNNVSVEKTGAILLTFNAATPTSFSANNFTQTSGNVTLPNTLTSFTINGNILLSAGTFLAGTGTINAKGNWTITAGTFTHGSGTVSFNSSTVAQTITGAVTFNNLTMNNTFATGSLTLASPVTVDGTLTMASKNIISSSANTLYLKGATTIGTATSYVEGPMKQNNPGGAKTMYFPIGVAGGVWRPFVLGMASSSGSDDYTAELINSSAAALGYTMVAAIDNVSSERYYQLTQTGAATFSSTATLYYSTTDGSDDGVTVAADLRVGKTIGAGTQWQNLGGTGTSDGTGSITSAAFTTFSKFTLANRATGGNPLPIELLEFSAEPEGDAVNLSWATATEINNAYFTVEKSQDGKIFENVIVVMGAGNSSDTREYRTKDNKPYTGVSYYRLKQTDFDGKMSFSDLVPVQFFANNVVVFNVFPNPSDGKNINVRFKGKGSNEEVLVVLNDLQGRDLFSKVVITDDNGEFVFAVDVENRLPAGIYLVVGTSQNNIYSRKLVIR